MKKMATALQCLVSACFNLPRQTVRMSEGLDIDVDARSSAARSDLYVRSPPDFVELSKDCAVLARGLTVSPDGTSTLDFQDEAVLRALTERLLLKDFGVHVSGGLSHDRLCPAVPNRLAYVAWIEELVHGTDLSLSRGRSNVIEESDQMERKRRKLDNGKRRILDVGTGACCIYALLGCATNPDWTFVGTDIDAGSLQRARRIVSDPLNAELQLRERITLVERRTDDPLLFFSPSSPADAWPAYHATMCNPPFYASRDEMARSAAEKATPPSAVCTGADVEMTTAGGEVAFVSRIIDESCLEPARSSVVWFTSMVGKHASVAALVTKLVSAGVSTHSHRLLACATADTSMPLSLSTGGQLSRTRPHQRQQDTPLDPLVVPTPIPSPPQPYIGIAARTCRRRCSSLAQLLPLSDIQAHRATLGFVAY